MVTANDPTVFVVDDDAAARESVLALVASHGMAAVGYDSAESFLRAQPVDRTGCLVLDYRMPGMTGLDLQERLKQDGVEIPVVMITAYGDVPLAVRSMRNGAVTFLGKPCRENELWESIEQALAFDAKTRRARAEKSEIQQRITTLTADEMTVLRHLVLGWPNKNIAKQLDIGLRTVELRKANILRKMKAGSLAELVRMAMVAGIPCEPSAETGSPVAIEAQAN